jgi:hypothetical protein
VSIVTAAMLVRVDLLHHLQSISSVEGNGTRFGHIVAEIKGILHSLHRWQCIHASRDANTAAHTLAKLAKLGVIKRFGWKKLQILSMISC